MPRHPPCALNNLTKHHTTQQNTGATTHKKAATPEIKMLASTVQFSTNNQPPPPTTPPTRTNVERSETGMVLSEEHRPARRPASAGPRTGPLPQDPTACLRPTPARSRVPRSEEHTSE